MAKKAKNQRRERIEQMRKEAAQAERRRTLLIIGACGVVALLIIGATTWALWNQRQEDERIAQAEFTELGEASEAAGCDPVETAPGSGSAEHVEQNTTVEYDDAPPAFGKHYPVWASFDRKFYTEDDRPPLEMLVHNLEHGYTILWYDQTVAQDEAQLQDVQDIAAKFEGTDDFSAKFIAAPWTAEDGADFPDGKHVALTHWSREAEDAVEGQGAGVWQYCEAPSGEVVANFMDEYPNTDAMEPNAS